MLEDISGKLGDVACECVPISAKVHLTNRGMATSILSLFREIDQGSYCAVVIGTGVLTLEDP